MQGGLSRGQRESAAPRDVPLFPLFPRRACPRVSAGHRSRLSRSARGARQHDASSWMADAVDVCAGGLAVTGWTRPPPRAGWELWECRWANERWSPRRRANERASGAAIRTRRSNAAREPERYSVGHVRRAQGRGGVRARCIKTRRKRESSREAVTEEEALSQQLRPPHVFRCVVPTPTATPTREPTPEDPPCCWCRHSTRSVHARVRLREVPLLAGEHPRRTRARARTHTHAHTRTHLHGRLEPRGVAAVQREHALCRAARAVR